jgi:hypothetical protein
LPKNASIIFDFFKKIFLLATFAANDLANIPQMGHGSLGFCLLSIVIVLHINGVGTAVGTLNLHTPTALMDDHSAAPTNGANIQFNIVHNYLLI